MVATAPLPFVAAPTRLWQGLPLWLWWSFGATVALSLLTAWGFLRYWRDEDE